MGKGRRYPCFFANGYVLAVELVVFFLTTVNAQGPFIRNVALNKRISANLTCGLFGPEFYLEHNQVLANGRDREKNQKLCLDASQHPPSSMNDGNLATFWQSTSRTNLIDQGLGMTDATPDAIINLNLEQIYKVNRITLKMGDAKRPGRLAILKSTNGVFFEPWVYLVTEEGTSCTQLFRVPVTYSPLRLDSVVCRGFGRAQAPSFEDLAYDFTSITGSLESWRETQYIQFQLFDIDLTLGPSGNKFQHYTIRSLEVLAQCECNGQEVACNQSVDTSQYECTCGGFTQGRYCGECQPLYNQNTFVKGQPCEECNCFGHAPSCYFDPNVANNSLSLNKQGEKRGGGVCVNCLHNTTGNNCERCVDYFYRPDGVAPDATEPCVRCQCNPAGVRLNQETQLVGDCVRNDAGSSLMPAGMLPGDCFCKANVQGPACDSCQSGYFNLTQDKPGGCQECLCDAAGSANNSGVCTPDAVGQCPCKQNVQGRQCDTCKEAFYLLDLTNDQGCSECQCDPGAAFNNVCDVRDGQCPCRSNVRDRQCLRPMNAYYYPNPHFIYGEFEDLNGKWDRVVNGFTHFGYAISSPGVLVSASFIVPAATQFGDRFMLQLRYGGILQQASATLQILQTGVLTPIQTYQISFAPCTGGWCYYSATEITLIRGQMYRVTLLTDSTIFLDQVVALPFAYLNPDTVVGKTISDDFKAKCNVLRNEMNPNPTDGILCRSTVFSLAMFYLDGALPCECHPLGSYNNVTCEEYEGQCLCKPGVFTRQCGECQLEYYQLSTDGCKPCDCASDNKVCDRVSGQCKCPNHTIGRQCDLCELNHYNWTSDAGCQDCQCNVIGSSNLQCNLTSGECECKQGVMGEKCDQCMEGFKGFGPTGCSSCQCNADGTNGTVCESITGQCPCKSNTEGLLCELCKTGTFYNNKQHAGGCLDCVCMGVTAECQSTFWHLKTVELGVKSASNGSQSALRLATDGAILQVPVVIATVQGMEMAQATVGQNAKVFWQHPDFSGNLLGLYGSNVSFTVFYTSTDPNAAQAVPSLFIYGRNNVIFEFPVEQVPVGVVTPRTVPITVENVIGNQAVNLTRGQLMLALSDVTKVLIPASYFTWEHETFIRAVSYQSADSLGTGARALSVESCSCPVGYSGLSCEVCAEGYRRENVTTQGYLGLCVPCECNSHSSKCDPDTGVCLECQDNTQGPNCEVCQVGFYGDATQGTAGDCSECPCYQPRVVNSTCELLSGVPTCLYCAEGYTGKICDQCLQDYFGNPQIPNIGTCEKCDCNGNSDVCAPTTGVCVGCAFNTTGDRCDVCAPGFYGNASTQSCQVCGCNPLGSESMICDANSGNCTCFAGVGTETCDACLPDYYGYQNQTFQGCRPCECNEFGSTLLQCDDNGQCPCKPTGVASGLDKCDSCVGGFWGLPNQECQACGCDAFGSVDPGNPCDRVSGQCECKLGIAGRRCDECERLYTGTPQTGCTKCGRCEDSLGNDTLVLQTMAQGYLNQTLVIQEVQTLDPVLVNLTRKINTTLETLGMSSDRLTTLTENVANLTNSEPQYTQIVQTLMSRRRPFDSCRRSWKEGLRQHRKPSSQGLRQVTTAADMSEQLKTNTLADLERVQSLESRALEGLTVAQNLQAMAPVIIERMSFYNKSANELLDLANSIYLNMNTTFDTELQSVRAERTAAGTALTDAQQMETMVTQQANLTSSLQTLAQAAQTQLLAMSNDVTFITQRLTAIAFDIGTVYMDLNITQYNKQRAEGLLTEAQNLLDFADSTLTQTAADYVLADQWLRDAITIRNGTVPGTLPINTTVDLTGISGWLAASDALASQIQTTSTALSAFQLVVGKTEQTAEQLTMVAQAIQRAFLMVQPKGQTAVNAINKYETVVKSLEESLKMALQANETMARTSAILQSVSVTDLTQQATDSLAASRAMLQRASLWNDTAAAVEPSILAANDSLQQAINEWSVVNGSLTSLQTEASNLNSRVLNNPLTQQTIEANSLADRSLDTINSVSSLDQGIQDQVNQQASQVAVIQSMVRNASQLQVQMEDDLNSFQQTLTNNVQNTISQTQSDYGITNRTLGTLEAKLATIEEKLRRAREKLASLEQPVHFPYATHESLDNPDADKNLVYTEIVLEFKYTYVAQGVLFFTQNLDTEEKVLIQLVDGAVIYEIRNVDSVMNTTSPAILCSGCWFRVVATRYGIDGHLTVTKMSTGGVAVTSMREESSKHELLKTTSLIYVGGLPDNFTSNNVYASPQFEGCIYNMRYNGDPLPIWQRALRVESQAQCCAQPPSLPAPATQDAVNFKGFGYIKLSYGQFSVAQMGQVSFQFRTFDPNAVLVLMDQENSMSYYGIFLRSGKVVFGIQSDSGEKAELESANTYNDGKWYKVSGLHSTTLAQLSVQKLNLQPGDTVDIRSQNTAINLTSLATGSMTVGGQNPNTTLSRGPISSSYAGAMLDFQLSRGASQILMPQTLRAFTEQSSHVDLYKDYKEVVSGLGLEDSTGYATLSGIPSTLDTIEFDLLTYKDSGVLMFAQLRANPPQTYFYIGLYNGNVVVLFDQGLGTRLPVRTRAVFLANGQPQSIKIDFSFQNSPRLTVNGQTHYGAVTMSPHMNIEGNTLYVGGVPPSIAMPVSEIPSRKSLIGGIRNLLVNGQQVDFFNEITVNSLNQKGVSLSGLPAPPTDLPPLPYSTTPAPPTTPAPTCAAPVDFTLGSEGVRFGDASSSFMGFDVTNDKSILSSAFSIRVQFRAIQDNGILVYFESTPSTDPRNYFAVYMSEGYLYVSMRSTSARVSNDATDTIRLRSKYRYNDGTWWEMQALRINDFMAIMVVDNRDYQNNLVSSAINSTLEIDSNVYIGGVPPNMADGVPFTISSGVPIGGKSFKGCIREAKVVTHGFQTLNFDIKNPQESEGVTQCYENVAAGIFMEGTNSYVRLMNSTVSTFSFTQGFSVNVTFRSTRRNGTLVAMWQSPSQYFLLGLYDGEVRALVSNLLNPSAPFLATSAVLQNTFVVCDNEPHTVVLTLDTSGRGVTLQVDQNPAENFAFPGLSTFQTNYIYFRALYVGLPVASWNVPSLLGGESFQGCVVSILVNNAPFYLLQSTDKRAIVTGCPASPNTGNNNQLPVP